MTLAFGGLAKSLVMVAGSLLIMGSGFWQLAHGEIIAALVLFIIVEPVWLFVADIATGIILLPFVGLAAMWDRARRKHDGDNREE
jgi:hypothetical protein